MEQWAQTEIQEISLNIKHSSSKRGGQTLMELPREDMRILSLETFLSGQDMDLCNLLW